jgi:capsular polysaccharide biosynthesis protein
MTAYVADFRSRTATLRRRARVVIAAGVLGLIAGSAYVVFQPTPLTSTALVLLPTPALAESSTSDVVTQVRIAESANILERAGLAVDPVVPGSDVKKMLKVSSPTNQLIQIDVTSADGAQAQVLAQAVADAYVNYVRDTAKEVVATAVGDLRKRLADLQAQGEQLQKEVAASLKRQKLFPPDSSDGRAEAQLLGSLRAQQADVAVQLDKVQEKIATGTPVGSSATGTLVVQKATAAEGPSTVLRLVTFATAGALAGILLAVAIILLTARRDMRVRLRDDIADAIGSPVLAAVRSRPQRSVAGWLELLGTYRVTPVESWALRQVLRGLVPVKRQSRVAGRVDHPQSLTVVTLSGDGRGLAIGPQLSAFASSLGITTRLVPTVGHDRAPTLWACATDGSAPARPNLFLGKVPDGEHVDLTIFLVVVERRLPYVGDMPASDATILSVAAGSATEQELARVAVAVDDAGRHIDGIVVADPDPTDRTSGRHTIAERSSWPTLPTRLTGIPSTAVTAGDTERSRT